MYAQRKHATNGNSHTDVGENKKKNSLLKSKKPTQQKLPTNNQANRLQDKTTYTLTNSFYYKHRGTKQHLNT